MKTVPEQIGHPQPALETERVPMTLPGELILYGLAKLFYRSELGHDQAMKDALLDKGAYANFRAGKASEIVAVCRRRGVRIDGATILDLGCSDGAITQAYLDQGAARAIGVDIDAGAITLAQERHNDPRLDFRLGSIDHIPLDDASVDSILCYDVFEHVSRPREVLNECYRVLRPGGKLLIFTCGWRHPYAPHLWSTMPVPWAHVFFSERTLLRACRRVYLAPWYRPNMHDLDARGQKRPDRFRSEAISTDYLNKLLLRDFERVFAESGFEVDVQPVPFRSRYAFWTRPLIRVPWIREFVTAAIWAVLTRPIDDRDHARH